MQKVSVSEFLSASSDILAMSFEGIVIEGEVSSYKVSQNKFVFFDLKDEGGVMSCFMMLFAQRFPLADGMRVAIRGTPKIVTTSGRFSFAVSEIMPIGEGDIKKSFEMLKSKLEKEGLFDVERKRPIEIPVQKIGVVSSLTSAGYKDFLKILDDRWGGIEIYVVNTSVQGISAADEIIGGIDKLNVKMPDLDVIALIRGGGSAEDLAVFNDEKLIRAIADSRIPIISGIGHEVDVTLADLVADVRASTPSNAAERLTRDKNEIKREIDETVSRAKNRIVEKIDLEIEKTNTAEDSAKQKVLAEIDKELTKTEGTLREIESLNPEKILKKGYAIIRNQQGKSMTNFKISDMIEIETDKNRVRAEVKNVEEK